MVTARLPDKMVLGPLMIDGLKHVIELILLLLAFQKEVIQSTGGCISRARKTCFFWLQRLTAAIASLDDV